MTRLTDMKGKGYTDSHPADIAEHTELIGRREDEGRRIRAGDAQKITHVARSEWIVTSDHRDVM